MCVPTRPAALLLLAGLLAGCGGGPADSAAPDRAPAVAGSAPGGPGGGPPAAAAGTGAAAALAAPVPDLDPGQDPGLVHVHGLGVDPADGRLYAAAHTGLFRVADDTAPERVAGRLHDVMGFAVVGPGEFLASGHPDPRQDLPAHLGLLRSTDAGTTWEAVSLLGEADFHALAAGGDRVYGWDSSRSRLLASRDRGATWERVQPGLAQVHALAVDPADPDVVLAADGRGQVLRSADGLVTVEPVAPAGTAVLLSWDADAGLVAADAQGRVRHSGDGGATWEERGSLGGAPAALLATPQRLVAATHTDVLESTDGGRAWSPYRLPAG